MIGPDAIGYANATAGLLQDGSFRELEQKAIKLSGSDSSQDLFDQEDRAVYRIVDKSLSIKTEFLIGAFRIGFPSIAASMTHLVGLEHLLGVIYVAAAFFLGLGGLMMFGLFRGFGFSLVVSLAVALVSVANINLLVGVHEGGIVQAFVFFAVSIFMSAALHNGIDRRARLLLFGISGLLTLSSYMDMFVILGVTALGWWTASRFRQDRESRDRAKLACFGFLSALFVMLPLSLRLPVFLIRRLADARQGGWSWDSWTELGGIVGLSNPYLSPPDSLLIQLILVYWGVMLYVALKRRATGQSNLPLDTFSLTVVLATATFYVYSRYVMNHTTYQWFKLVGSFAGPISAPLIILMTRDVLFESGRWRTLGKWVVTASWVLILATSFQYSRYFFGNSSSIPAKVVEELNSSSTRLITGQYVVFGRFGWEEMALTPWWPAKYVSRNDYGLNPVLIETAPVGLIVREDDCPGWKCLDDVDDARRLDLGTEYRLLDLGFSTDDIRGLTPVTQWLRVNAALKTINGPVVSTDWTKYWHTQTSGE
jgi:hypothetical protein